jgi:hypothetical protein
MNLYKSPRLVWRPCASDARLSSPCKNGSALHSPILLVSLSFHRHCIPAHCMPVASNQMLAVTITCRPSDSIPSPVGAAWKHKKCWVNISKIFSISFRVTVCMDQGLRYSRCNGVDPGQLGPGLVVGGRPAVVCLLVVGGHLLGLRGGSWLGTGCIPYTHWLLGNGPNTVLTRWVHNQGVNWKCGSEYKL